MAKDLKYKNVTPKIVAELIKSVDKDGNGVIDFKGKQFCSITWHNNANMIYLEFQNLNAK